MSKHVQTVQSIYDAFNRGDIPAILDLVADDAAWESWKDNSAQNSGVPWMLARKGKAGALDYFKAVGELKIINFTVLSIMGNEHQVAAEFFIEAEVPATGAHYSDEEIHLWTFDENGKIIRLRHYLDTAKHIEVGVKK